MTDTSTVLPAVERTLELSSPPERVWRALTDPAEIGKWFGQRAKVDLRKGGGATFYWDGYGDFAARIEAVDPPHYFAWRWGHQPNQPLEEADDATLVEWWLDARPDGGTTLRLRESGFRIEAARNENIEGWTEELAELEDYLAGS